MTAEGSRSRPLASVSLDADNLWSYLRTRGAIGWEARPSFFDRFLPLVLDLLDELGLRITFFVVGADAAREENGRALAAVAARGHEIGNHSHEHEPWLQRYSADRIAEEVERAETAIQAVTGQRPLGFRGPGYSWSPALLRVLHARGYRYDASVLPTFIGPLARAYYFRTARLTAPERRMRAQLFGRFSDALRPDRPYRWALGNGDTLLEMPVTTIPVLRLPMHLSYLLYLSAYSERLMMTYLRAALAACRTTRTPLSFLLHPLDLLSGEDVPELAFFPGMQLPAARKRDLFRRVLALLGGRFDLVGVGAHARALEASEPLPLLDATLAEQT
ncbi:MAG TPA: polysaccharide deacetylase family protein [Gemmatimonadales bacterium]|nr:polysaccharide deacetylase family protein [Gemmatimonadales bacterium]